MAQRGGPRDDDDDDATRGRLAARVRPGAGRGPAPTGLQPLGLAPRRDGLVYVAPGHDPGRPAPLVVALHGAGAEGGQMTDLLVGAADARGLVVLAPDSRGRTWDAILGGFGPDVRFVDRALGLVLGRYAIDPARVAVGGFSDGASYALSLGLANGGAPFTHVIAYSPGFVAAGARAGAPALFVSHGTRDAVLPVDRTSRRIVPSLAAAGHAVEYREFDGGHVVPPEIVDASVAWFLA